MKVRMRELSNKERIEILDTLYTAAGTVRGRDAMKLFLRDLLTPSERIMLGRRLMIARRLLAGESTVKIAASLKVGRDTIWRVQKWLDDELQGYEKAVANLEKAKDVRYFKGHFRQRNSLLNFLLPKYATQI